MGRSYRLPAPYRFISHKKSSEARKDFSRSVNDFTTLSLSRKAGDDQTPLPAGKSVFCEQRPAVLSSTVSAHCRFKHAFVVASPTSSCVAGILETLEVKPALVSHFQDGSQC